MMTTHLNPNTAISQTTYSDPVDIKKLEFIFSELKACGKACGKKLHELKVLEIGCGGGAITIPVASAGSRITGVDISYAEISHAKEAAQLNGNYALHLVVANGGNVAFREKFDLIIASEVLEHVYDPIALVTNMKHHMLKYSRFLVTIPNGWGPWEIKNRLNPKFLLRRWETLRRLIGKQAFSDGDGLGHCQFFTQKGLLSLFGSHSFKLLYSAKSDGLLALSQSIRRHPYWGRIDCNVADRFPYWLANGWYFVFELTTDN